MTHSKFLSKLNLTFTTSFVFSSLLLTSGSFAATATFNNVSEKTLQSCEDKFEVFDNTQVQTMESGGLCYISVHPRNVLELVYRDFLFDSAGLLMVFDSYGQGSESRTTAARNFHLFPRQTALGYRYVAETKTLEVQTPSGKVLAFNTIKSILVSMSDAKLGLDYRIHPDARGGVEILEANSLIMDGGFKRGQSPSQNPKNNIVFRDAAKNTCAMVNNDVYRYTSDNDAIFKFNDIELKAMLARRCPQLQF